MPNSRETSLSKREGIRFMGQNPGCRYWTTSAIRGSDVGSNWSKTADHKGEIEASKATCSENRDPDNKTFKRLITQGSWRQNTRSRVLKSCKRARGLLWLLEMRLEIRCIAAVFTAFQYIDKVNCKISGRHEEWEAPRHLGHSYHSGEKTRRRSR